MTEAVRFASDIKPLFRAKDRLSMRFKFDLASYNDVSVNADKILTRLRSGTMPCDGGWASDRIEVFERWIQTGKNP